MPATTITIPRNAASASRVITAVGDAIDEADETAIIDITGVTNGRESGAQQQTVSILDDDGPQATLSLTGSPFAESGGTATVTATLSAVSPQPVTVDLGFGGTATNVDDYTLSATSITIPAASLTGTVTLTGAGDATDEDDETVVVEITGVTNGFENGTQQVTATIADDDAPPTVSLGITGSPLAEAGGSAIVSAGLSAVSARDVTVDFAFSGTATDIVDYNRSATSVTIPAGTFTGLVTLTAVDDLLDETDETIVVDITSVTNGTEDGAQQVTAGITDDDASPTVTLEITGTPFAENGGVATVTATLSAVSGQPVTVSLGFGGTATNVSDYFRSAESITIAAGTLSGAVTLSAADDGFYELDETVVVDIAGVTNGTEDGVQQVTATITDDDPLPFVTLSLAGSPLAESAGSATVTATLSETSVLWVDVALVFTGSAAIAADYMPSGATITIPAGALSAAITLTGVDDALDEPDETVVVDIASVTHSVESGTQQVTATITDDDAMPSVTLTLSGSPFAENAGVATVTATLSAVSGLPITAGLGFSGTATTGADYAHSSPDITIAAGDLSGTATLTGVDDALDEVDESVVVDITSVVNATEDGVQQVAATIADDDAMPTVTLGLAGSPMAENGGFATVTATLSAVSSQAVSVQLAFAGTATSAADYVASDTAIVIAAGSLTGTATLAGVDDTLDEVDETFVVDVAAVTNGTEDGTQQVTATIADDDAAPTVALSLTGSPLAENAGVATITATLSAASSQAVNVQLAFAGTATSAGDYLASDTSITIAAGSFSGAVTLTAVDDALDEVDETVVVDIASVANGLEDGTQQVTATIIDDDAIPTVALTLAGSPLAENGGIATVAATLSAASGQTVAVGLSFTGSATSPGDYAASGLTITIPAGSRTGTVTLTSADDALDEVDESVIVDISAVTNGAENGTQQVAATITDDDAVPTVRLTLIGTPLAENAGATTVTATLSAVSGQAVTIDLALTGSATIANDYLASTTTITIAAGSLTGTATLTGVDDALDEVDETVIVDISAVANGTEDGTQQVTATITDDDAAPTVALSLAGSPLAENSGIATVTATLSAVSGQAVTIDLALTGSATIASDYLASTTTITIAAG
ncbi:MAG: beta strand repeat-containing protein, partial [Thermoanaerobaculia bacterium]